MLGTSTGRRLGGGGAVMLGSGLVKPKAPPWQLVSERGTGGLVDVHMGAVRRNLPGTAI